MKLIDLDKKMNELGVRNTEIARDTGSSEKAVSEWRCMKKFPKDKSLNYLLGKLGSLQIETEDGKTLILSAGNPTPPPAESAAGQGRKTTSTT